MPFERKMRGQVLGSKRVDMNDKDTRMCTKNSIISKLHVVL
jgi:hypothetical protein